MERQEEEETSPVRIPLQQQQPTCSGHDRQQQQQQQTRHASSSSSRKFITVHRKYCIAMLTLIMTLALALELTIVLINKQHGGGVGSRGLAVMVEKTLENRRRQQMGIYGGGGLYSRTVINSNSDSEVEILPTKTTTDNNATQTRRTQTRTTLCGFMRQFRLSDNLRITVCTYKNFIRIDFRRFLYNGKATIRGIHLNLAEWRNLLKLWGNVQLAISGAQDSLQQLLVLSPKTNL